MCKGFPLSFKLQNEKVVTERKKVKKESEGLAMLFLLSPFLGVGVARFWTNLADTNMFSSHIPSFIFHL